MNIIPQVASAMQTVLTTISDTIALATGFVKRRRKLTGCKFVQTLVFGWLANPQSTLDELSQTAATLSVSVTPQALEQRFTPEAAETLKQILDASIQEMISADSQAIPLLERFNGVYIQDSSWVSLPSELVEVWEGCGGGIPCSLNQLITHSPTPSLPHSPTHSLTLFSSPHILPTGMMPSSSSLSKPKMSLTFWSSKAPTITVPKPSVSACK